MPCSFSTACGNPAFPLTSCRLPFTELGTFRAAARPRSECRTRLGVPRVCLLAMASKTTIERQLSDSA